MNIFGDKTIKAGDMAMIVRDCCGRYLGRPLKVSAIVHVAHPASAFCAKCNREYSNIDIAMVEKPHRMSCAPLFWLKKIEPPADGIHEEEREELHA